VALRMLPVGKEEIVLLPELVLFGRRERRLVRERRGRVHGERKVLEPDGDRDAVDRRRLKCADRSGQLRAERALEVGNQHDLDVARRRRGGRDLRCERENPDGVHGQLLTWKVSSTIRSLVPGGSTCSVLR